MADDEKAIIEAMKAKASEKMQENAESAEMAGFSKAKVSSKEPDKNLQSFHLKIYSPYKVYYEGDAQSVSAENDTGPFDVLPNHKNFLTLLKPCTVVIRNPRGKESLKINRGIMHVKANSVVLFLDV